MARADELILGSWRDAGWEVQRQELRLKRARFDGANLLAVRTGQRRERRDAIVLIAHHDTVRDSPAADDNGAAVALLLELASALGGRRFRRTVILAAPDFEELGLLGSRPLVRWLRARYRVVAAIVFDPIGFMSRRPGSQAVPPLIGRFYPGQVARLRARDWAGDMVVAVYRRRSVPLARSWAECLAATIGRDRVVLLRDPADLPLIGPLALALPVMRNFARSDHVNFWRAGLPAIHVTNTANFRNPAYHRPGDTPDTLDYRTLAGITAATELLVERLAGRTDARRPCRG